jgi:hypothetical protein
MILFIERMTKIMKRFSLLIACLAVVVLSLMFAVAVSADGEMMLTTTAAPSSNCLTCHDSMTPGIVESFGGSKMAAVLDCTSCHGNHHADKTSAPTIDTCAKCHADKVAQYKEGKHALAWDSMVACPVSAGNSPILTGLTNSMKGCNQCHTVGIISDELIAENNIVRDVNPCDSCHLRHTFSVEQAKDPESCAQCHIGFDHPQYEMWVDSAMGVAYEAGLKAPSCVECHMKDGNHAVKTAWGFLALRYPEEDAEWLANRIAILQGLGVVDRNGEFTDRLKIVSDYDIARLTAEDFNKLYSEEKTRCQECHAASFVEAQFNAAETVMKEADAIMAEAIKIVYKLFDDKIIKPTEGWDVYPDLLQFHNSDNTIENELFDMFLSYRNRAFQSTFHMNADYTFWYGMDAMRVSLDNIKAEDATLRALHAAKTTKTIAFIGIGVAVVALAIGVLVFLKKK